MLTAFTVIVDHSGGRTPVQGVWNKRKGRSRYFLRRVPHTIAWDYFFQAEIEEEEVVETTNAEVSRRALTEVLGSERRDRILSALYMVRHDSVNVVRQSSIHIWKALVQNTPRTGNPVQLYLECV